MTVVGWRDRMRQVVERLGDQPGHVDADRAVLAECAPLTSARRRATQHLLGNPPTNPR